MPKDYEKPSGLERLTRSPWGGGPSEDGSSAGFSLACAPTQFWGQAGRALSSGVPDGSLFWSEERIFGSKDTPTFTWLQGEDF